MIKLLCAISLVLLLVGVAEAADTSKCYQRMQDSMRDAERYQGDLFSTGFAIYGTTSTMVFECEDGWCEKLATSSSCDEICTLEKNLAAAKARKQQLDERTAAKKRWDAVMKECVK